MHKLFIKSTEAHAIAITEFVSLGRSKCTVIISSATGVKQEYYYKFSEFLRQNNVNVYTFDYTGIGNTKPVNLTKIPASASSWAICDLETVIKYVRNINSPAKLILLGHSIGGQLIGLTPSGRYADGILLVASQSGYWGFWKGSDKVKMYAIWHFLIPVLSVLFGYFPGKKLGLSEDLPKNMALEWRKWCCSKNYLFDHHPDATQKYETIHCPIVSFSAEDDHFAAKITVDWLTDKYANAQTKRKHLFPAALGLEKIGHFGFFKRKYQTSIWNIFLSEIEKLAN